MFITFRGPKTRSLFSESDSLRYKYSCLKKKKKRLKSRHFVVLMSAAHILKLEQYRSLGKDDLQICDAFHILKNNDYNERSKEGGKKGSEEKGKA